MNWPILSYFLVLLCVGAYAFFSLRKDGWRKWIGSFGFIVLAISALLALLLSLGTPLNSSIAMVHGEVVSVIYVENEAIYLWVVPDGSSVPVAIALPWSTEEAKHIRQMETQGTPMELRGAPEDGQYVVHPKPVEENPPKK